MKDANEIKFPVLDTKFVPIEKITANDYNPNKVAREQMKLLAVSIENSGFTQAVVCIYDAAADLYVIVDGFHRFTLLRDYFKCSHVPVVVLEKTLNERMAATVRHNRARGKHTRSITESIVEKLTRLEMTNAQIAKQLGMRAEEVLRLKQARGIADHYANRSYSRAWEWIPGADEETELTETENAAETI